MMANSEERNLLRRYFGASGHAKRLAIADAAGAGRAADDRGTNGTRCMTDPRS